MKRPSVSGIALIFLTAGLIFPAPAPAAGRDETVKVIVPVSQQTALERMGASLVARRGSYLVYQIPLSEQNRLDAVPGAVARPDFDRIELNRGPINTLRGPPAGTRERRAAGDGGRLMLVQFPAPPVDDDLALLTKAGAIVVNYIPQNAYIVWADGPAAGRLEALAEKSLQFVDDYHPAYALSPCLDSAPEAEAVNVTVQIYNYGPDAAAAAEKIASAAAAVLTPPGEALGGRYINLRISARGLDLGAIAAAPGVVSVAPYTPPTLFGERQDQIVSANLNPAGTQPTGPGYFSWLASQGFDTSPASYPIVDVVDDGFDNGNASNPANAEFREFNVETRPSRVQYAVIAPGAVGISSPNGVAGHGNINASILGGYNESSGSPYQDGSGYQRGLGVCPYGRLAATKIFQDDGDWGWPNESTMVNNQYAAGVRITSNSWGCGYPYCPGDYDADAQAYDSRTRDAQGGTSGNQQLLFVFAAGNDGDYGTNTVGSPGTAKNVITAGASENYNATGDADGCGLGNSAADDAQDVAFFSSFGPCDDGRVKPEIMAPGTHIMGAAPQIGASFSGGGVCGGPYNDFVPPPDDAYYPAGQTRYTWSSGTSHSTPGISGCVALIYSFLSRIYAVSAPSPALLKAYLIHTGRHLTGDYANDNLPSIYQGFGLVNLSFAFKHATERYLLDQTEILTTSGQTFEVAGVVDNPGEPFRAALVWTDAPGPLSGSAYVNDLDLEVTVNGTLYRGNNFLKGVSQAGGSPDPRNNTECVFLPASYSGHVDITVRGTTIAGDGVPGNGDATDQDFALVVYNFNTTPWQNLIDEGFDGFDTGSRPAGWIFTNCNEDTDTYTAPSGYYGRALPSINLDDTGDTIATVSFANPRDLRFWTRGVGAGTTGSLLVEEFYSGSYYPLVNLTAIPDTGTVEGPYTLNNSTSRLRFTYTKDSGDLAFDDVRVSEGTTPTPTTTPSVTPTPSATATPVPTATATPTPRTPSPTLAPARTPTPSPTAIAAPSPTPTCGPDAAPLRDVIASGDYDGDGAAEIAIFRPSTILWSVQNLTRVYFGGSSDHPAPADYDGDGTAEIAIFRASTSLWSVRGLSRAYYGIAGDIPVSRDYDADGTAEIGVFRESSGQWLIRNLTRAYFGQTGDWPAPGYYAGAGTLDLGVFRPGAGLWAVRGLTRLYFGLSGDWPVPADYSGDGAWRPTVFRPCRGMWAVRYFTRVYFGNCLDVPRPGDFDGNGTEDYAIFRAPAGFWSVRGLSRAYFGNSTDIPVTR